MCLRPAAGRTRTLAVLKSLIAYTGQPAGRVQLHSLIRCPGHYQLFDMAFDRTGCRLRHFSRPNTARLAVVVREPNPPAVFVFV